jgi:hypothetical protein
MSGVGNSSSRPRSPGSEAKQAGQSVEQSRWFNTLVTVGLVAYGVVHLLVAWIALQIAWTGGGQQASQKGAFQEMASTGIGLVLLWITAVGLFALALWQAFEAIWGHRDRPEPRKRLIKRIGSAGKAVLYVLLAISAIGTAVGSSSSSSGDSTQKSLTSRLMSVAFGRILVAIIGLAVVATGARLAYRGIKKKFTRDLEGGVSKSAIMLGLVGYIGKGAALAGIGVLFLVAAITYDPQKAGGLDTALRTLRAQPFGEILLTLIALGIASFGLYCFVWSRHWKKT